MRSERGEGRTAASGVVTQVLMRPPSVMVRARLRHAEQSTPTTGPVLSPPRKAALPQRGPCKSR
jgi:hypothetical protein